MRVLLINLPYFRLMRLRHRYFPLGLGYLASVAKTAGYEVLLYNMEKDNKEYIFKQSLILQNRIKSFHLYIKALEGDNHYVWCELKKVLMDFEPNIVGISVWTTVYPVAKKVASFIKDWRKNTVVVVGGIHPTVCDKEVASQPMIDFVVRGEGEETFLELLNCIRKGVNGLDNIRGITYKCNGEIKRNPPRELIPDIDRLPSPEKNAVLAPYLYSQRELGSIITSRGCPYSCSFCSSHEIWGRKVRLRDINEVFAEIKQLYEKHNVTFFTFFDDTFTIERKRIFQFCENVTKEKLYINWFAHGRIDNMDEEYIYKLREGRCLVMQFGIESGSQTLLDKMNKGLKLDEVYFVRKLFKKLGILFWVNFLIGYPDEKEEDLRITYEFIKELHPDIVNINVFVPYPGSKEWSSFFSDTQEIHWEYLSPQSYFAKFNNIENEKWLEWRKKIETLADNYNMKTKDSIKWFFKLYFPRIIRHLRKA